MLPRWLWLWFPPLIIVIDVSVKAWYPDAWSTWIAGENGLVELSTFGWLVIAVVVGVLLLRRRHELPDRRLVRLIGLVTIGCLYFAGEEVSWGQHFFGWRTPDAIAAVNYQQETNLHNTSGLFDQAPRTLLTIVCLVGGFLAPIVRRKEPKRWAREPWMDWAWPTMVCLPTAVLVLTVRIPQRIAGWLDLALPRAVDLPIGETEEYYFAFFLLLYLLSMYRRLVSERRASWTPRTSSTSVDG